LREQPRTPQRAFVATDIGFGTSQGPRNLPESNPGPVSKSLPEQADVLLIESVSGENSVGHLI
jgi:hypothetical protein